MLWLLLGLVAALGDSGADAVTKRYFSHLSPYGMVLARLLGSVPFLALAVWFISLPALDRTFWVTVAAMIPLEVTAYLLYMRALKISHLSLSIPFLAFTPVFLILTGWVLLGEVLNSWGVAGTLLIAVGSYMLGLGGEQAGFWAPLRALAREPGPRLMLMVAAIYSLTAAMFKLSILHSGPMFFGVAYPLAITGIMMAGYPWNRPPVAAALQSRGSWGLILGFCAVVSILSMAQGIKLAPVTYIVAVKRLSLLFSVLLGGLWLQERPFLPRILGASLMCAGVALITLRG